MKKKLFWQFLIVFATLVACSKENSDPESEELKIYYNEINKVISIEGQYNIDIDGDSINDYYIRLFHANFNEPIFVTLDTFYIEFGSLSDEYYFMDKGVDCVPCYDYLEPYETWSGSCLPFKTSRIISSHHVETAIEGKEDAYLWLERHEKSGCHDYYFTAWLRIKVSEKRDTLTIKDSAIALDNKISLRIGER